MSDQIIKLVIGGVLLLHGLGHGGAIGALIWIGRRPGTDTGGWRAARSWLFPSLQIRGGRHPQMPFARGRAHSSTVI